MSNVNLFLVCPECKETHLGSYFKTKLCVNCFNKRFDTEDEKCFVCNHVLTDKDTYRNNHYLAKGLCDFCFDTNIDCSQGY